MSSSLNHPNVIDYSSFFNFLTIPQKMKNIYQSELTRYLVTAVFLSSLPTFLVFGVWTDSSTGCCYWDHLNNSCYATMRQTFSQMIDLYSHHYPGLSLRTSSHYDTPSYHLSRINIYNWLLVLTDIMLFAVKWSWSAIFNYSF